MATPSNLYAEKIFAEHPIALWSLDDKADYVSLIDESDRNLTNWTITGTPGGTANTVSAITNQPFLTSAITKITGNSPAAGSTTGQIICTSPTIDNFSNLNSDLTTFVISSYLYSYTSGIRSVEIGYQYGTSSYVSKTFSFTSQTTWEMFSQTFEIPNNTGPFKVVIKFNYVVDSDPLSTYEFLVNGLTVGQRSEEFNATSLGATPINVSSDIAIEASTGIETSSYGLQGSKGYYLVNKNSLVAKNFGVPMVYGSQNVTTLIPNSSNKPSLIIPGFGFLNESGQYRDLTLEFWLKVNSGSSTEKRIVGPISSTDGLYVNQTSLILKIGNYYASHFVGEWGRPMLVDIRIINNSASMLVNGEQVLSMLIDTASLSLPSKLSSSNKDQDWIGFYSYEEVSPIQLDCVAVYSYQVPEVVAKRRFVYGQGVDFPENINSSYSTTSVYVDYPFANYSNNYNYPDIGKWNNGIVENLSIDNNILSMPQYSLPTPIFSDKTVGQWNTDISAAQGSSNYFISLRPNSGWNSTNGYLIFPGLNVINESVKAIYGVFDKTDSSTSAQTLFRVYNEITKNYFEAVLIGNDVKYNFKYSGTESTILTEAGVASSGNFMAGINIERFSQSFGGSLASFFGDRSQLKVYLAGNKDLTQTFSGKIFAFGFSGERNYSLMASKFKSNGAINPSETLGAHIGSYQLFMKNTIVGFSLDIAAHGSWQDYIPLSYFAKYVKNAQNQDYYTVDVLQLNLNYPEPKTLNGQYDTSTSNVRTYISFQSLDTSAIKPDSYFIGSPEAPSATGVIEPGTDWAVKKYEAVNGMIIYPPENIDISKTSIAVNIEFKVNGILSDPVAIKSLQFASLSLNDITENSINSRFGVPVLPYTKLGIYFNYKRKNPFEIYKGSTPYLYFNKHNGLRLRGDHTVALSRGLLFPINMGRSEKYAVGAIQAAIRYDDGLFPETIVEAFEIESDSPGKERYIKFYLVATDSSRKRGRIYAVDTSTGLVDDTILFYINGTLVRDAVISQAEWVFLGIQFGTKIEFGGTNPQTGAFRITGPITMNNISHYQYNSDQEEAVLKTRPWVNVLNTSGGTAIWNEYIPSTWGQVLYLLGTTTSNIDPGQIYKIYTGTNKFIIDSDEVFRFNSYGYRFYKDVTWQSAVITPV